MTNPISSPSSEAPQEQQVISAQKMWIDGLIALNVCYRLGTQRGADAALTKIEKAKAKLQKLGAL